MRIPRSALHQQVFDLVRFLNTSNPSQRVDFIPYILEHPNNKIFIQGEKTDLGEQSLPTDLSIPSKFHGKSAREVLSSAITPWLALLRQDFEKGWEELLKHDNMSFRYYLFTVEGWPHEMIEFVELLLSQTNQYDLSFLEIIMQNLDFDTQEWVTVAGGMSNLIESLVSLVGLQNIRLESPIKTIAELATNRILLQTPDSTHSFDKVLLALPPAALKTIPDRPKLSFMKEASIRGSHYEPLYKIGLHFRSRSWESLPNPSFGGQSTTDLRFRWIVYPSNDIGPSDSGVLLLYAWMIDAARLNLLSDAARLELILHDLEKFFKD